MAPVTDGRDRAQLILIGALALAVSLVIIALVLNSAIYTHNLASRYQSPAESPSSFARDTGHGAGETMDWANREYADNGFSDIVANYEEGLIDLENATSRYASANSRVVRIDHSPGSETEGVWIGDKEPGGSTFYPVDGTPQTWRVAEQVNVRRFHMNTSQSTLASLTRSEAESLLADPEGVANTGFVTEFDDGSSTWRVGLYENSDTGNVNIMVHEDGTTTYEVCVGDSPEATIRFTAQSMNGEPCNALRFVETLSAPYDVTFYHGGLVDGWYEVYADRVVDDETTEAGPFTDVVDGTNYGHHCGSNGAGLTGLASGPAQTYYEGTNSQFPRVSPSLYEAELQTSFSGQDTTHETTQRVAPESPSDERQTPHVTMFAVYETDADASDGEWTVEWAAEDPNGDPVDTTVEIVEPNGATQTFDSPGSPPATFDVADESGIHVISLTVDDGPDDTAIDGNSRTVTQHHEDDGDNSGCPP